LRDLVGLGGDPERRNFSINVVEGALFIAGATFISVQTVLPAMVVELGGGNVAVGALGVIAWGGLFLPQLFSARYFESLPWKKPWAIRLGLIQRLVVGLIAFLLLLFGDSEPSVALVSFLALYALMQVVLGITTPGWFDLVAKVTPVVRRGRLAGYRSALAGIMGFGCSLVLTWILTEFEQPVKYSMVFGFAFLFMMISLWVQAGMVESVPSPVTERRRVKEFLSEVPVVLRQNDSFRNFIIAMAFLVLATISITFFSVFAIQRFGAPPSAVGEFTMMMVVAQVVSAPVMGLLADRFGNKTTLVVAASALFGSAVWALLAPTLEWFYLVFGLLGVNVSSETMARYNIAVEFAVERKRGVFLGLMNALLAPCYLVGLLGGWISDVVGYPAVFVTGASCSLVGMSIMILFVREPRRHGPAESR